MTLAAEIRAPLEQEGTKAVVRKWLKAVGDAVRADDPVVEIETDKVAVEVAAEADGVLTEILVGVGADAGPGALLGRLELIRSGDVPAKPRGSAATARARGQGGHGLAHAARAPAHGVL